MAPNLAGLLRGPEHCLVSDAGRRSLSEPRGPSGHRGVVLAGPTELNPVENIWQFMRDNWLSNRIFKSYDDILDHCCFAWNKLIDMPWKIMSNGTREWAYRSQSTRLGISRCLPHLPPKHSPQHSRLMNRLSRERDARTPPLTCITSFSVGEHLLLRFRVPFRFPFYVFNPCVLRFAREERPAPRKS